MGVSRSAAIVVAYLMKEHRKSLPEALDFLKSKRKIIHPNGGFLQQLRKYALELGLDGTIPQKYL
jgi:protein-tyrosine phosphatase